MAVDTTDRPEAVQTYIWLSLGTALVLAVAIFVAALLIGVACQRRRH